MSVFHYHFNICFRYISLQYLNIHLAEHYEIFVHDSTLVSNFSTTSDTSGTLALNIVDISNDNGLIMIAMSDSHENYGDPKFTARTKVSEGKSIHKSEDIPFGEYAIKVYHDDDSDRL